jgi:hypothetical protein
MGRCRLGHIAPKRPRQCENRFADALNIPCICTRRYPVDSSSTISGMKRFCDDAIEQSDSPGPVPDDRVAPAGRPPEDEAESMHPHFSTTWRLPAHVFGSLVAIYPASRAALTRRESDLQLESMAAANRPPSCRFGPAQLPHHGVEGGDDASDSRVPREAVGVRADGSWVDQQHHGDRPERPRAPPDPAGARACSPRRQTRR